MHASRATPGDAPGLLARAEQRFARPWLIVPFAIAAGVLIMALTSGLSFQGDEWEYIVDRRLTFESLLRPHNEHLVFLHALVYRGLVETIGTGSYLPFLGLLMLLHGIAAAGLLRLLRAHLPPEAAMAAVILYLFLGTGFDNLVWAFQSGFVGATAAGVWSLVSARRAPLAALLLTVSLWTHGNGLFFVLPLAVLISDRRWLVLPLVTYTAWLLIIGRQSTPPPDVASFVTYAGAVIASAFGGLTGAGTVLGGLVALFTAIVLTRTARRGDLPRVALAGLAGLASESLILAFGRAHFGIDQALASRYIYTAAPFLFMLLPALRVGTRATWTAAFVLALAVNIGTLPYGVALYHAFLNYDRSIPLEQRLAPFR